jgi:hypothetical protein
VKIRATLAELRIPPLHPSEQEPSETSPRAPAPPTLSDPPKEIGGRPGPEPTRYGDWEKDGRCIDF